MYYRVARWVLPVCLLACAAPSLATDAGAPANASGNAKASSPKANSLKATSKYASDPKQKVVDINSASKQELMKLPYIDDATADKIIAGRPYLSKAHLVTRKIIGLGPYQVIAKRIVAKQDPKPEK